MVSARVATVALACASLLAMQAPTTSAYSRDDVRVAAEVFNNKFYNEYGDYGGSRKAMYMATTKREKREDFWREIEAVETLIDAFEVTNNQQFKERIRYLYHGFRDKHGLNWANNKFNDDIIWGVIMAIRGFEIYNDGGMKDIAIENFNLVWDRAWDNTLDGGLWWTTNKETKNACVNAPAAIAGMLLYRATGDASFKDRAHMIMQWTKNKLFDAGSGEVKGAMNAAGKITEGGRTYTQGTFIGAAGELQHEFPDELWLQTAIKATDFAKDRMSGDNGLLPDEYCGTADCPGFKSIFARWVGKFVQEEGQSERYGAWLDDNARAAWAARNTNGLMWAKWGEHTPNDGTFSVWEAASGVSMMSSAFFYRDASNNAV